MRGSGPALRSTQIVQATKSNRVQGVVSIIVGGLVALGLWSDHEVWSIIVLLLSVVVGGKMVVTGKGDETSVCPVCEKPTLIHADSGKFLRCSWCYAYSERDSDRLVEVEKGRVEASPTFLFPIAKTVRFPLLCCACGRPASGSKATHTTYSWRHQTLPAIRQLKFSVDLPFCKLHAQGTEGADTAIDYRTKKAGGVSQYPVPGLKVSSYLFYRECLLLNGIKDDFDPKISW